MMIPILAAGYVCEDQPATAQVSVDRGLRKYYLNLHKEQNSVEKFELSDDEDDERIQGSEAVSDEYSATRQYYKMDAPKDYTKAYINNHKVWTPQVKTKSVMKTLAESNRKLKNPSSMIRRLHGSYNSLGEPLSVTGESKTLTESLEGSESGSLSTSLSSPSESKLSPDIDDSGFMNYLHLPKMIGEQPLPPLVYHTACSIDNTIYYLGGVTTYFKENFSISDLSHYVVDELNMPMPINSRLLNNPTVIPNKDLYILSAETNVVSKAKLLGDIPPPLLCMSASQITKRHIFYYGGFEIQNKVRYDSNTNKIHISKSVYLNNSGYVLDTVSLSFQKFELIAHPNLVTRFPVTVPRFGHTSNSMNLAKRINRNSNSSSTAATVFIMGGYRQDSTDPTVFKPIQDIWKVELTITYKGKHDFIQFGENVLATPIPGPFEGPFPLARAFHTAQIYDANAVHGAKTSLAHSNPNRIGLVRPASPSNSSVKSESTDSSNSSGLLNLRLIVHGGTNGKEILGDSWSFDFDEEIWTPLKTWFHEYDGFLIPKQEVFEAQLKRAAHSSIIQDKYLVIVGGAMESDFHDKEQDAKEVPDISPIVQTIRGHLKEVSSKADQFQRFFVLNIETQTWLLIKYFHEIVRLGAAKNSDSLSYFGNVGTTVVESNSRIFVYGGQLIPHQQFYSSSDHLKLNILNNSLSIVEFPLGSASASSLKNF